MSKLEIGFCSDVGYGSNRDKTWYPDRFWKYKLDQLRWLDPNDRIGSEGEHLFEIGHAVDWEFEKDFVSTELERQYDTEGMAETGESYYIFEEEFYKVGIFLPSWEAEYVEIISIDDLVSALIDRESGDIPWMFKNHVWLSNYVTIDYVTKHFTHT